MHLTPLAISIFKKTNLIGSVVLKRILDDIELNSKNYGKTTSIGVSSKLFNFDKSTYQKRLFLKIIHVKSEKNDVYINVDIVVDDIEYEYNKLKLRRKIPSTLIESYIGKKLDNIINLPGFDKIKIINADKDNFDNVWFSLGPPETIEVNAKEIIGEELITHNKALYHKKINLEKRRDKMIDYKDILNFKSTEIVKGLKEIIPDIDYILNDIIFYTSQLDINAYVPINKKWSIGKNTKNQIIFNRDNNMIINNDKRTMTAQAIDDISKTLIDEYLYIKSKKDKN